jgi:hypothetical protein
MRKFIENYLEDALVLAGCLAVLIGLSLWNTVVTLVVAGAMLIGLGLLVGKARS